MTLLYEVKQFPLFQNRMYNTEIEAKACPKGDVRIVENPNTGLIYNELFNPDIMKYDKDYQNEQAISPLFYQHLVSVSEIIAKNMGKESIVEIGCGKGTFLNILQKNGFDIRGFDPIYEGMNPLIIKAYYSTRADLHAKGIILRHVLEHIQDPLRFLEKLNEVNGNNGKIYIEVPCFDWICKRKAWFDIFYEHVNYFRLADFFRMFDVIYESGYTFGGQYLYLIADLASLKSPKLLLQDRIKFPEGFDQGITQGFIPPKHGVLSIWGGASKGVIFSLLKQRSGCTIDLVIDINSAKQGKYLPAIGLRVFSPEEALSLLPAGSTIYVMNSNYMEEIIQMSSNAYHYIGVDDEQ